MLSILQALHPDGLRMVTGGMGPSAKLWSLATGNGLQKFSGHNGSVVRNDLIFSFHLLNGLSQLMFSFFLPPFDVVELTFMYL